jgi:hypothetical protein
MEQQDDYGLDEGSPQMKSARRRRVRRAMLKALAGGGLTAVGLGGSLSPGALAADVNTAATGAGEDTPPPAATGTTQSTTPPAQQGSSSEPTTTTSTSISTSTTPAAEGQSSTSTAPSVPSPAPAPASNPAPAPAASPGSTAAPTVVVQRPQQAATPARPKRRGSKTGGTSVGLTNGIGKEDSGAEAGGKGSNGSSGSNGNSPTTVPPGTPNNVAAPPQSLAGASGTLASVLGQSTVSAQALDFYRVPLFLLPIYQAAGIQYGVPWQILAAINEVETDYGNDQSVSTAGAVGWMQFMPETWLQYGVDALGAGYADPYNPVDAIFAAARYLHAAGASSNLHTAILAYNHSEAYVSSVLLRAKLIASYPQSVIATLTGLTEGRLPIAGAHVGVHLSISAGFGAGSGSKALSPANATAGAVPVEPAAPASAEPVAPAPANTTGAQTQATAASSGLASGAPQSPPPAPSVVGRKAVGKVAGEALRFVDLLGPAGAPVTAVEDGRIVKLGHSHRLGNYLALQDIYGDVFTYAGLGSIAPRYHLLPPSEKVRRPAATVAKASTASPSVHEPAPKLPASAGRQPLTLKVKTPVRHAAASKAAVVAATAIAEAQTASEETGTPPAGMGRKRLYAVPDNPVARVASARKGAAQVGQSDGHGGRWLPLRLGSLVSQGTILGHLSGSHTAGAGQVSLPLGSATGRLSLGTALAAAQSARLRFAIRPAGDSTTIDPRPILANWRQLDTALHPKGVKGTLDLLDATVAQVFLMSQSELERTVLSDPGISLSGCGRQDVAAGAVDGRVLAVLEFLSRSGLKPTVGALRCEPGTASAPGLATEHRLGDAIDITAINGIPIAGHQGEGSITDVTIRALLTLQGRFVPRQIVSLMQYPGAANTLARPDHWNNIHIGFRPSGATVAVASSTVFTTKAHSAGPGQTAPSPLASAGVGAQTAASPLTVTGDLSPAQWNQLIARIGALPMPTVATKPTPSAIHDPQAGASNRDLGTGTLPGSGGEEE